MPYLELNGGERHELPVGDTIIGSGAQAGWRLPNVDLAARHFAISVDRNGEATLRPATSQNVVVVNGHQATLQPLALCQGDRIEAGDATFTYLADPDAPCPPRPQLETSEAYLVDGRDGIAFPVSGRSTTIGRDAGSGVFLREPEVSRFHADIRHEAGGFVLYAMGASGTTVNGELVTRPRLLHDGDDIRIGGTTLRFTLERPTSARIVTGVDLADEEAARKATIVNQPALAVVRDPSGRAAGIQTAVLVLIAVVAVAVIVYLILRG